MAFHASKEMLGRLEETKRRFDFLTEQITQPQVINNRNEYLKLSKERADLETKVMEFMTFSKALSEYEGARAMMEESDAEIRAMASAEAAELEKFLVQKEQDIQLLLLPKDPNDDKNVVMEIRQGVGGDEAGLFVGDLYRAYQKFADKNRWKTELISIAENAAGGFREVVFTIEGDRAYSKLKYESGAHRVQRVPKTETQGRVHTSTATVAVLPEAEEIDLKIEDKDLKIDVFRAGGNGGQSVNTTDSAVRITYLPTNEVVICRDEKSQLKNKNKAMKVLRSRLLQKMEDAQHGAEAAQRRSQIGTGLRNERIRTYNFPQGRVTDHRIGFTQYNIDDVMAGEINAFIQALTNHYQTIMLKGEDAVARPMSTEDDD